MKPVLILLIRAYKYFISPLLPPSCRFYPSCSDYALKAVAGHGAIIGTYYGARRLLKCHPYHPGGYDPVPDVSIPVRRLIPRGPRRASERKLPLNTPSPQRGCLSNTHNNERCL